jgi:photoactive yellow protein
MSDFLFNQSDLISVLCSVNPEDYNHVEFGIVAMALDSVVTSYNRWESQLSGLRPSDVIGKHFFTEVAPCTNNFMVALRYDEEDLDATVNYVFSYRLRPTPVRLRLLKSTKMGRQFMIVERAPKA